MRKRICGIYAIKNIYNGKMYIGRSINVMNRGRDHFYDLRNNQHHSNYLQNSFNKYGENAFIFGLIEEYDKTLLTEKERYWIDYYDTFKNGYNESLPSDAIEYSRVLSPESKQKLSNSLKTYRKNLTEKRKKQIGANISKTLKEKYKNEPFNYSIEGRERAIETMRNKYGKTIYLYNKDTHVLEHTFSCRNDLTNFLQVPLKYLERSMTNINRGKWTHIKGYIPVAEGNSLENILINRELRKKPTKPAREKLSIEELSIIQKRKSHKAVSKLRDSKTHIYHVYTVDNVFIGEYYIQSDIVNTLNLRKKSMQDVIYGVRKSHRGYIIKKIN